MREVNGINGMKVPVRSIPLSSQDITDAEIQAVLNVMQSPKLSMGPRIEEFEALCAYVADRRYGIAVNSGTSALHLIVRALNIADGDEVITTPFSFVASSNVFLMERAKPVFVDIDPLTLNIDPTRLADAVTSRTKAMLVVDVFGHPVDMDAIRMVSGQKGLPVIEDSCEAIGASYSGIPCGKLGVAGTFAFYPNKQITTGEGGCIVTDDEELALLAKSLRNQGRGTDGGWLLHERLGYNYRMSELQAAVGVEQLKRLPEILEMRNQVALKYMERLFGIDGIRLPVVQPNAQVSWFVFVIRVDETIDRNALMAFLQEHGVACRDYFSPIHLQPLYRERFGFRPGDFPITERVAEQTIALPFFNRLSDEDIDYVGYILERGVEKCRRKRLRNVTSRVPLYNYKN